MAHKKTKTLIFFFLFFLLSMLSPSSAKEYGPEYFKAVEGEISGQALPGVEAVYVNGSRVLTDNQHRFSSKVYLNKGEKYLSIKTQYKGLVFTKKYLVARHPQVDKSFKITVSQTDYKKLVSNSKAKKITGSIKKPNNKKMSRQASRVRAGKKNPKKKPQLRVTKPQIDAKWLGFEFVAELEPNRFLAVQQIDQRYFGTIYHQPQYTWLSMKEITYQEFKDLLEKGIIPKAFRV